MPGASLTADVAIVTYGGGERLAACVAAVRRQGTSVASVVLIDNASPDGTADVAAAIPGIDVVRNPKNVGYAAAMNQAFARTSAPYLLSLNADCELGDGYVAACIDALEANPTAAGATGVLRLPDGRIDSSGIALSASGRAGDRDRHANTVTAGAPFGVSGAAAVWRRAALEQLGSAPWWEFLFVYWDDVELCWRLRDGGWTFVCVEAASATHVRGSDTAAPTFIEAQSFRNRLATLARHGGAVRLVSPRSLGFSLATATRLALRHRDALRAAHPLTAIRVGLATRRQDQT